MCQFSPGIWNICWRRKWNSLKSSWVYKIPCTEKAGSHSHKQSYKDGRQNEGTGQRVGAFTSSDREGLEPPYFKLLVDIYAGWHALHFLSWLLGSEKLGEGPGVGKKGEEKPEILRLPISLASCPSRQISHGEQLG